jgi:class 3 adenylate cyclase
VAARTGDYARPGEVLVTQDVVVGSGTTDVELTDIGLIELKGLPGAVRLSSARRSPADVPTASRNPRASTEGA